MKDLLDTLDRMTAYEERMDSKKTRVKTNRTRVMNKRATDGDAEDTGLEQYATVYTTPPWMFPDYLARMK